MLNDIKYVVICDLISAKYSIKISTTAHPCDIHYCMQGAVAVLLKPSCTILALDKPTSLDTHFL